MSNDGNRSPGIAALPDPRCPCSCHFLAFIRALPLLPTFCTGKFQSHKAQCISSWRTVQTNTTGTSRTMHSFAPSLSFLLSISTLALQLAFSGLPTANAASEPYNFNHTTSPREFGAAGHNAHRRRHADIHAQARSTDLMLYPGRRAAGAEFTYFVTGM